MPRRMTTATGTGARSNTASGAPGTQGTLGGIRTAVGGRPGSRSMPMGDEVYLWILLALEVGAISWLRATFSRYHGG
jgi:hypothetical protein